MSNITARSIRYAIRPSFRVHNVVYMDGHLGRHHFSTQQPHRISNVPAKFLRNSLKSLEFSEWQKLNDKVNDVVVSKGFDTVHDISNHQTVELFESAVAEVATFEELKSLEARPSQLALNNQEPETLYDKFYLSTWNRMLRPYRKSAVTERHYIDNNEEYRDAFAWQLVFLRISRLKFKQNPDKHKPRHTLPRSEVYTLETVQALVDESARQVTGKRQALPKIVSNSTKKPVGRPRKEKIPKLKAESRVKMFERLIAAERRAFNLDVGQLDLLGRDLPSEQPKAMPTLTSHFKENWPTLYEERLTALQKDAARLKSPAHLYYKLLQLQSLNAVAERGKALKSLYTRAHPIITEVFHDDWTTSDVTEPFYNKKALEKAQEMSSSTVSEVIKRL